MAYLLRVGATSGLSQANGALTPARASTRLCMIEHVSATQRVRRGRRRCSCSARTRAAYSRSIQTQPRLNRVRSAHRRFHKRSVEVPYRNVYSRACLRANQAAANAAADAIRATGTSLGARAIGQLPPSWRVWLAKASASHARLATVTADLHVGCRRVLAAAFSPRRHCRVGETLRLEV